MVCRVEVRVGSRVRVKVRVRIIRVGVRVMVWVARPRGLKIAQNCQLPLIEVSHRRKFRGAQAMHYRVVIIRKLNL